MTSLGALLSISAWLFTKNAKQLQGDYEGSIISLSNKVFISFLQYSNNLGLIWIDLAFIGISFSLNSGIYGNFTIWFFLFQNAFGKLEHISFLNFYCMSKIFLFTSWACSFFSIFSTLISSLRKFNCFEIYVLLFVLVL